MSKTRPTIYLDTSILSALHYRGGSLQGIARQVRTREWCEQERGFFEVRISRVVLDELEHGTYRAQEAALREAWRISFLPVLRAAHAAADAYLAAGIVPESVVHDALQLAVATVHRMDYLLTWNSAHLANPEIQVRLRAINSRLQLRTPWLVSPDSIPRVMLGQPIRRTDD
ncbi:MAG: PIN domain-containing protein [Planctomycetota bacterium]|nr:PIN domain-containing protein [Planctomycetota bacterium]